ncbi:hypothetical protein ACN20G_02860 [Streptomyces sp. BI20]|uniref:hypothetical protein n=1 Tax=Streptomyces sp. BI20 TaxID=3403460 RepID=UPI003C75AAA0
MTAPRPTPARRRAPLCLLACLLPLATAGCAVDTTGPVPAGRGAIVHTTGDLGPGLLHWTDGHGGLVPIPVPEGRATDPTRYLELLLRGPGPDARRVGLGSEVPEYHAEDPGPDGGLAGSRAPRPPAVRAAAGTGVDADWIADLPYAVGSLDATARRQIVCTVATAVDRAGRASVAVRGPDTTWPAAPCDLPRSGG